LLGFNGAIGDSVARRASQSNGLGGAVLSGVLLSSGDTEQYGSWIDSTEQGITRDIAIMAGISKAELQSEHND